MDLTFERFTKKPFVVSPGRDEWRSSWLESEVGKHPGYGNHRHLGFQACYGYADVREIDINNNRFYRHPKLGVRRLLRLKKASEAEGT